MRCDALLLLIPRLRFRLLNYILAWHTACLYITISWPKMTIALPYLRSLRKSSLVSLAETSHLEG